MILTLRRRVLMARRPSDAAAPADTVADAAAKEISEKCAGESKKD
jgi:hypothetical protein